jgi:hypothetical protein
MKLHEAKQRVRQEMEEILSRHGISEGDLKDFAHRYPVHAMTRLPHRTTSTAGNFIGMVARRDPMPAGNE